MYIFYGKKIMIRYQSQNQVSIEKFLKRTVLKDEKNLDRWKFQLIYDDSVTRLKIIGFEPRFFQ